MGSRVRQVVIGLGVLVSQIGHSSVGKVDEDCYVRTSRAGHPAIYLGHIVHDVRKDIWKATYSDTLGDLHEVSASEVDANDAVFKWLTRELVGVLDKDGNLRNAVPIRLVLDMTKRPYRMRLIVRLIAGGEGEEIVDHGLLRDPNPELELNTMPDGRPAIRTVQVKFKDAEQEGQIEGMLFMGHPIALSDADGGVNFQLRGVYRWKGRNVPFAVDYIDVVSAVHISKHQPRLVSKTRELGEAKIRPTGIQIDLTRSEVGAKVQITAVPISGGPEGLPWAVDVGFIDCHKIVLNQRAEAMGDIMHSRRGGSH